MMFVDPMTKSNDVMMVKNLSYQVTLFFRFVNIVVMFKFFKHNGIVNNSKN